MGSDRAIYEEAFRLEGEVARLRSVVERAQIELNARDRDLAAANARADAAEARAEKALAQRLVFDEALLREKDALAAARRECALYRGVIDNLLSVMEMQEKRESGAFHITGEVMFGIWSDAKSEARGALAAPGDGEGN